MHADVTGIPVYTYECGNSPLLGSAILATIGTNLYHNIDNAIISMVRKDKIILPNLERHQIYSEIYEKYKLLSPALTPIYNRK